MKNHIGITQTPQGIHFAEGVYDFYPEDCTQRYCYFCNNDEGIKTIAFDLADKQDFTMSGDNAKLLFHGRISPIVASRCKNLVIQGITIDFEDCFVTDADLVEQADGIAWLRLYGPHSVENGRIVFTHDFYDNLSHRLRFAAYDVEKKELRPEMPQFQILNENVLMRQDGLVGLHYEFSPECGRHFIIRHEDRLCPAIVIDDCKDVALNDVCIHHAAGMGVLAQCCDGVALNRVTVKPNGRRVSVSDDAVHFVECRGNLAILGCELSDTMDDSINVHGIYRPLKCRLIGAPFMYLDTGHFQQQGIPGAKSGDTLELMDNATHIPYARVKVQKATRLNKQLTRVDFSEPLPSAWHPGDCARVLEVAHASLTVQNCVLKTLNGRGILASGLKSVLLKDNVIHTSGAGIFVSGGATYWYETGPVDSLEIVGNTLNNCCYNSYASTREPLAVFPELPVLSDDFYYHGTIRIADNRFVTSKRTVISILSAESVTCTGNTLQLDQTYDWKPVDRQGYYFNTDSTKWIATKHCYSVSLDNPEFD